MQLACNLKQFGDFRSNELFGRFSQKQNFPKTNIFAQICRNLMSSKYFFTKIVPCFPFYGKFSFFEINLKKIQHLLTLAKIVAGIFVKVFFTVYFRKQCCKKIENEHFGFNPILSTCMIARVLQYAIYI